MKQIFSGILLLFDDPVDVGNLISGSSAFSKSSLNIWRFMVHVLLKPGLENFEHYFASMRDDCNCAVVWTFLCIAFLRDCNENRPFPVQYEKAKYRTLKDELPRSAGAQYATGDQWLVPLPFLKPAWTSGSSQFTYCWSLSWRILSITLLACEMSAIVW